MLSDEEMPWCCIVLAGEHNGVSGVGEEQDLLIIIRPSRMLSKLVFSPGV